MRKIPQELEGVRSYYSHMFFAAVRDSFQPERPEVPEGVKNFSQRSYARNRSLREREAARKFILERSMAHVHGESDGFGFIYEVLRHIGSLYVPLEEFVEAMKKLWEEIDADPSKGRDLINQVIQAALKTGVEDIVLPDEYAEFGTHGWAKNQQQEATV